jgi:hypothetical protein
VPIWIIIADSSAQIEIHAVTRMPSAATRAVATITGTTAADKVLGLAVSSKAFVREVIGDQGRRGNFV